MKNQNTVEIASGECGKSVKWFIKQVGEDIVLTIDGNGPMTNYLAKKDTSYYSFNSSVTKIVVKEGVTLIGDYAFEGFIALTSVELSSTVEYIGSKAFSSCTALGSIKLPEGLKVISPKAFIKCTSLASISFPSTLVAIDFKAFDFDENLKHIEYAGTETQWKRQVRISKSSLGDSFVLNADFTYASSTKRYDNMTSIIGSVIEQGGDGRLYIVTPNLTVDNVKTKSGDCSLIIFPDGKTMMIDSGIRSSECHVMEFVKKLGLKSLDSFVLSHPHSDHIGNALTVAKYIYEEKEGFVGTYYYSGLEYKTEEKKLATYLAEHGTVMHRNLRAGDKLTIGSVKIELFNPFDSDMFLDDLSDTSVNDVSLAMKFTYGVSTFLTSGDLYAKREAMLVDKFGSRLCADIAKTNHHGNFTSNSDLWYEAVNPKILVSDCDDIVWTIFTEKLVAKNIKHYKVSECGLTIISMGKDADYKVETEF